MQVMPGDPYALVGVALSTPSHPPGFYRIAGARHAVQGRPSTLGLVEAWPAGLPWLPSDPLLRHDAQLATGALNEYLDGVPFSGDLIAVVEALHGEDHPIGWVRSPETQRGRLGPTYLAYAYAGDQLVASLCSLLCGARGERPRAPAGRRAAMLAEIHERIERWRSGEPAL